MKDPRDRKDWTIHDVQHVSDEYSTLWRGRGDLVEREPRDKEVEEELEDRARENDSLLNV